MTGSTARSRGDHARRGGPEADRLRLEAQPRCDTAPETAILHRLHALGYLYHVDVRPARSIPRRADIASPRLWLAVFVDGCSRHATRADLPARGGEDLQQPLSRETAAVGVVQQSHSPRVD